MAAFVGEALTPPNNTQGEQRGDGFLRVPPQPIRFFLAAFDNGGARYFWKSYEVSFRDAPTPVGTYVTTTLIIEGRLA